MIPGHPGRLPRGSELRQQGLTLIEIVVVLTLVGTLMLAAVPSLRAVFEVNLRTASRELAATLRYVYDEAAVQNITMRVVYDLDHSTWWVEGADSDVRIFANRDQKEAFAEWQEQKALSDEEVKEKLEDFLNCIVILLNLNF